MLCRYDDSENWNLEEEDESLVKSFEEEALVKSIDLEIQMLTAKKNELTGETKSEISSLSHPESDDDELHDEVHGVEMIGSK